MVHFYYLLLLSMLLFPSNNQNEFEGNNLSNDPDFMACCDETKFSKESDKSTAWRGYEVLELEYWQYKNCGS